MHWLKAPSGDLSALDGTTRYRIRRVNGFKAGAGPWFWLYVNGARHTPTGSYEDAVSFSSAASARRYAEKLSSRAKIVVDGTAD